MFTVLIIPSEQKKAFSRFSSLLNCSRNSGRIGVCYWNENAQSLKQSLPSLERLLENQKEWRAVIACAEKIKYDLSHEVDSVNPFDYAEKPYLKKENGMVIEEASPLIRLTHMLTCEIPEEHPEYRFVYNGYEDSEEVAPSRRDTQYQYELDETTDADPRLYAEWTKRNSLFHSAPKEILMVKSRDAFTRKELEKEMEEMWNNNTEFDYSEFAVKNKYPNICRFLVYDLKKEGKLSTIQSLFDFWCSIVMLTDNEIRSSILRPGILYRLGVVIDYNEIAEYFQDKVSMLNSYHQMLEKKIAEVEKEYYAEEIPDYIRKFELKADISRPTNTYLRDSKIKLSGGNDSGEYRYWNTYVTECETELKAAEKNSRRAIDQTVTDNRGSREFTRSEIYRLGKYEEEDLNEALENIKGKVYTQQSELPENLSDIEIKVGEIDKKVRREISNRMSGKQILMVRLILFFTVLLIFVPLIFKDSFQWPIVIMMGVFMAVMLITMLIVLFFYRHKLLKLMKKYERRVSNAFSELADRTEVIGNNLSNVFTHIRGASFLRKMELQKKEGFGKVYVLRRRIADINKIFNSIDSWNSTLNFKINMNSFDDVDDMSYDQEYSLLTMNNSIFPERNKAQVPINETDSVINSPYGFIKQLLIDRVEVYKEKEAE